MTKTVPPPGYFTDPSAGAIDWNVVRMAGKLRHIAVPGFPEGLGFFQQPGHRAALLPAQRPKTGQR